MKSLTILLACILGMCASCSNGNTATIRLINSTHKFNMHVDSTINVGDTIVVSSGSYTRFGIVLNKH